MYSFQQIKKGLSNPRLILQVITTKCGFLLPDKLYLRIMYWCMMKKHLNIKHPTTFNEKLNWMKLYDRNPLYTIVVDKFKSKSWVSGIIGKEHIIPILGVYDSFDQINFDSLPDQFVIKCSHNCGVVICHNKQNFDIISAKNKIDAAMSSSYYKWLREWPYKNVPRKVIVEQYMVDESGYELKDYKFFCFNGIPTYFFIATDRGESTTCFDFFDMNFNHLPIIQGHPNAKKNIQRPEKFEEMIQIASKLSQGFRQVRVDLYNVNGVIYFGEMTLFHFGGMVPFQPEEWDQKFGQLINLN